ncbi:hypothetical protein GP486_007034 [Trichoglossum hirsutum]|uniref:Nucleoside phosphorylase domain-containing protein n=1 Tax=Trichoglossum hirsutum TaxID=265104 RepID=A0A9P8IGD7_9PEZI|nr:hypothetical protein GP486_007034 [Trichoglossum hirsutum]
MNNTDEESDLEEFKEILPKDITVAIFCALSYESVAIKYNLDEEFECHPKAIGPRKYVYSFGRIGEHKVVIARPYQMGPVKAAQCAATVSQQFPNVRFALMVGIGAGIPRLPKCDIRLGDIAVSIPRDNHPGVLVYDFGKYESGGTFVLKGSLNKPPSILISADGSLEEDEMMNRSPLKRILKNITKQPGYVQPNSGDILFDETFHHVNKGNDCSGCEASSEKKVVPRAERDRKPGQPVVHRGLILSGSGVVKNPEDRDRLRQGHDDAVCFEMEAAGIMDEIPCLVVRGICDYADTHKQDEWHHYAAASAAAYSKALLLKVYGQDVEETRSMKEMMDKLEKKIDRTSNDVHNLKQEANDTKEGLILEWLTRFDYAPQQSDFLGRQQSGTGQWLLKSTEFQTWLNNSKQTLFCPGIPGVGKTILTAIVIDNLTTQFQNDSNIGIAYLYCNFRRHNEQKADDLLASLLKQLSQEKPSLPDSVKDLYDRHKAKRTLPSFNDISIALQSVTALYSRVFIIVDALDECRTSNGCLTKFLSELFNLQKRQGVNILATSRFIPKIVDHFKGTVSLEIHASRKDIERYLEGHMKQLPSFVQQNGQLQEEIKTGISEAVDGMFLLAQIYLNSLDDKCTPKAIRSALKNFQKQSPGSGENKKVQVLAHAYEQVMERINGQKPGFKDLAMRVLSWITCTKRPLNTVELQHALAVEAGDHELDEENFTQVEDMVSVCAGLVAVDKESNIIRLVHYTTQKYFEQTWTTWFPDAQTDITKICVTYLSFDTFGTGFCSTDGEFEAQLELNPLYDYAARNWGHHAHAVSTVMEQWTRVELLIQNLLENEKNVSAASQAMMASKSFPSYSQEVPRQMTGVHIAAYFGLVGTTMGLLKNGYNPGLRDSYVQTPLWWAADMGHEAVVKLLLEKGAELESKDPYYGQTPLSLAAERA